MNVTETEDGDTILPANAAALVATGDGRLDFLIPKELAKDGNSHLPDSVLLLAAFLIKVRNDRAWAEALIDEVFRAGSEEDAPPSPETGSEGRVEG